MVPCYVHHCVNFVVNYFTFLCLTIFHTSSFSGGADYSALISIPVTFDFEETVKSFTVDITDEDLYENTEDFFLDLEIPPEAVLEGVFKESPASTKIEIANDDGRYCIMNYPLASTAVLIGKLWYMTQANGVF